MNNKLEISDKYCFGGSQRAFAYFGGSSLITCCGNHLHVFDIATKTSTIQKLEIASVESNFTTDGLYQTSRDKNGLLFVVCWIHNHHQQQQQDHVIVNSVVLEMNPSNFYVSSKMEVPGRVSTMSISNDGKHICIILMARRKIFIVELWDREQCVKLAETTLTNTVHNRKYHVQFTKNNSTFVLLSPKKLEVFRNDMEGLKIMTTIELPFEQSECVSLVIFNETFFVGTNNGQFQEVTTDGIKSCININQLLFPNSVSPETKTFPVNYAQITNNFLFCSFGNYIIQWRFSADTINWKFPSVYKMSPNTEISWLVVGDNESSFVITSADGELFDCSIVKEASLESQCSYSTFGHVFVGLFHNKLILYSVLTFHDLWTLTNLHNITNETLIRFSADDANVYLISANDVTSVNTKFGKIDWHWRQISVHIGDGVVGRNHSVFVISADNCVREIKDGELVSTISFKQHNLTCICYSLATDCVCLGTTSGEILGFASGDVVGASANQTYSNTCDKIEKIIASLYNPLILTVSSSGSVTIWLLNNDRDWSTRYNTNTPNVVACRSEYLTEEFATDYDSIVHPTKACRLVPHLVDLQKAKYETKYEHLFDYSQNREFVLNSQIQTHLDEINNLKIRSSQDKTFFEDKIRKLTSEIDSLNSKSETIVKDITSNYETKIAEKGDQNSKLIETYVVKMDAMESKYKKLLHDLAERFETEKEKRETMQLEFVAEKKLLENTLNSEIKQLKKRLSQLQNQKEKFQLDRDNEIRFLKSNFEDQLKMHLDKSKNEQTQTRVEIERLKDELTLLEMTKLKRESEIKMLKTNLDELQTLFARKEKTLNQRDVDFKTMVEINKGLKTKIDKLSVDFHQTKFVFDEKWSKNQKEINKVQQNKEKLENEMQTANEKYSNVLKEHEQVVRDHEELLCKFRANQKLLKSQVLEITHKDKMISNLKQQIVELKDLSFLNQKEFKLKAASFYQNLDKL